MMINKKILFNTVAIISLALAVQSCQKMERPVLASDYPTDNVVLPDGPLRFYVPFDSTSEEDKQINIRFKDSISGYPSFFPDASIGVAPGVSGTAMQGSSSKGFVQYVNANDFGSTNFTIAFWINITLAQKDNNNADGLLAVSSTLNYDGANGYHRDGFWGNFTLFADHEASTSDSMQLKIVFFKAGDSSTTFDATEKDGQICMMESGTM